MGNLSRITGIGAVVFFVLSVASAGLPSMSSFSGGGLFASVFLALVALVTGIMGLKMKEQASASKVGIATGFVSIVAGVMFFLYATAVPTSNDGPIEVTVTP